MAIKAKEYFGGTVTGWLLPMRHLSGTTSILTPVWSKRYPSGHCVWFKLPSPLPMKFKATAATNQLPTTLKPPLRPIFTAYLAYLELTNNTKPGVNVLGGFLVKRRKSNFADLGDHGSCIILRQKDRENRSSPTPNKCNKCSTLLKSFKD